MRAEARAARRGSLVLLGAALVAAPVALAACTGDDDPVEAREEVLDPALVAEGKEIFRFETFGDEQYWTDTLRMHEVVQQAVTPAVALSVGLKVDADALPAELRAALAAGQVDLNSTATTLALLKLDAVIGVKGEVATVDGRDTLVRFGVTCALCHSTADDAFAPGIGSRLDGHANVDLDPGAIVALSPAVPDALKQVLRSWGPGRYDPRTNIDGRSTPIVLPPAYGLRGVALETFTGDGPVSYWNAYVAVTQMHGQGTFRDPRLGINIVQSPDLVTSKLPALRAYQLSLEPPRPTPSGADAAAAERGRLVFNGAAGCASCHAGARFTDVNTGRLHAPSETGMDPAYAERTTTRRYRTTPLRGLLQHPPYFHDGSAPTLDAVVEHYDRVRSLRLTPQQKQDLVKYLSTL